MCACPIFSWLQVKIHLRLYLSKVDGANLQCFSNALFLVLGWCPWCCLVCLLAFCRWKSNLSYTLLCTCLVEPQRRASHAGTRTADHELKARTLFIKWNSCAKGVCWECWPYFLGKKDKQPALSIWSALHWLTLIRDWCWRGTYTSGMQITPSAQEMCRIEKPERQKLRIIPPAFPLIIHLFSKHV